MVFRRLRLSLMIVSCTLAWFGHGILHAQSVRKPAKSPAVMWSVSVPAGTYMHDPFITWSGPLAHVTLARTIRLFEIDYDTELLPYYMDYGGNNAGPCSGSIALMTKPTHLEVLPPEESSLQLSKLARNQINPDPSTYPQYGGFSATLDLRGKNIVFQAGTTLWLYLFADTPGCVLSSSGNLTIEYEVVP